MSEIGYHTRNQSLRAYHIRTVTLELNRVRKGCHRTYRKLCPLKKIPRIRVPVLIVSPENFLVMGILPTGKAFTSTLPWSGVRNHAIADERSRSTNFVLVLHNALL
jgi:hypothetical protein